MSIRVHIVTETEWLRQVQRMSRKELLALCIEQRKEILGHIEEKTYLLQDVAYARRTIGEQWVPAYTKHRRKNGITEP